MPQVRHARVVRAACLNGTHDGERFLPLVRIRVAAVANDGDLVDDFYLAWESFLGGRGLYATAAAEGSHVFFVGSEASQAFDADRDACRAWLAARSDVAESEVGNLEDFGA